MKFYKMFVLTLISVVLGCNGGGGAGSPSAGVPVSTSSSPVGIYGTGTKISGTLLDAPISGISYSSTSYSGTTNSTGGFSCKDGENVEFKLNYISIGTVICSSVITPIELVTSGHKKYSDSGALSSDQSIKVNKMLVLLQMMDADENPSNGISVNVTNSAALDNSAYDASITSFSQAINNDSVFSNVKNGLLSYVRQTNPTYYQYGEPTETVARTHFDSTLSSIVNCSTSDVSNSASVTGVGIGSVKNCTALSCQAGYILNSQGLCDVAPTCAIMKATGVETFSGTYPNCVHATCSNHFALNSSGLCESTISNDYYCVSGTINQGNLIGDGLSEFPGVGIETLKKNSLKYNFVNQANGSYASGRNYGLTTAVFVLRNTGASELRKKAVANGLQVVASIPVGHWGKDPTSSDFYVSAVAFSNPTLIGNPMNQRAFRFDLSSMYTDFDTISSANGGAGTDISLVSEYNGYFTGSTISNEAYHSPSLLWRVKKNCDLSTWTVNY